MSARSSRLEILRTLLAALRSDAADLARNAPAARFIGEQVVRQAANRWCVRTPASRVTPSGTSSASGRESTPANADASPIAGYDLMTARQIVEFLAHADAAVRAKVFAYESGRRGRRTVLEAAATGSAAHQEGA